MSFLSNLFGNPNQKIVKELQPIIEKINAMEPELAKLSDADLRAKTEEFKKHLAKKEEELGAKISAIREDMINSATQELRCERRMDLVKLRNQKFEEILPAAFAVVREASKRAIGQRHYDAQLMGGIILHRGEIVEMKTGEGKTLTSTLAVYLNALEGKGVHVITVNDYLAKRDAEWMGQIYSFLGLSIGCLGHEVSYLYHSENDTGNSKIQITNDKQITNSKSQISNQFENADKHDSRSEIKEGVVVKIEESKLRLVNRREAYAADITYGTNNEFGFDYLRDNMVESLEQMVQRGSDNGWLNFAIIDEIDSILIDEARTPLIISAPAEESTEQYMEFARLVTDFVEAKTEKAKSRFEKMAAMAQDKQEDTGDYNVDEKMRAATFTQRGIEGVVKALGRDPWGENDIAITHQLESALKAKVLFKKDKDYVVKNGEVIIVDEFTGRLMYGRRYSEGLHQAIEAKEKAIYGEQVVVQRESRTMATVTFQNLFRLYDKLAGMTGTAETEAEEFHKIYGLEVVTIPTNKPLVRRDDTDQIYANERGKLIAVARRVKELHKQGRPILIGTIAIEKNEALAEVLQSEGIECNILNAKHHEREAEIIAQAGRLGAVTVATNMAGRGVDIILGGNPMGRSKEDWEEEHKKVVEVGGLCILGTERHESRRIDNQLRGRAGRQGDPGETQFFVSMEDDLMRIFGSDRIQNVMKTLKFPEDVAIENKFIAKALESAQEKIEGNNFDIRKHLLEYDDVLNKQREVIYKKRKEILENAANAKDKIKETVLNMISEEITQVVSFHTNVENRGDFNLKEIQEVMNTIFAFTDEDRKELETIELDDCDKENAAMCRTKIIDYLIGLAQTKYAELEKTINESAAKQNIAKQDIMRDIERSLYLRAIDTLWVEHLDNMAYLRVGIGLRGYGQQDPLAAYKKEAYRYFTQLLNGIQQQVVYNIYKTGIALQMAPAFAAQQKNLQFSAPSKGSDSSSTTSHKDDKIGRNDPCPCGAKKSDGTPIKYKHCCGK